MIRTRLKKVLLVASDVFSDQLFTDHSNVKHISAINGIFPSIHESYPDMIVFDYNFMEKNLENTLRRISANKFYDKIKVCCYKNKSNEKIDGLLKVLGVDQFIYEEDLVKARKSKSAISSALNSLMDASILKRVAGATH